MGEESWGTREFKDCGVNDKREAKSLASMADRLLAHPESSFSGAVGPALRKAAWRIFSKEEVDLSCGHYRQTSRRCEDHQVVLVSHDTTDISYPTHPKTKGLGDLGGGGGESPGIALHSAMVLSKQGLPLGLVGQKIWAPVATGREKHPCKYPLEEKESYRWVEALQWVKQYLAAVVEQVVVISDRESDFYEYMIAPKPSNVDLLFRAHHLHRKIYYNNVKMRLKEVAFHDTVLVDLFVTKAKKRKERTAKPEVSWGKIICPPAIGKKGEDVTLWVVKARETHPPAGEQAIEWVLITSIAVEDEQTALLMLDYYRKRWIIERWFLVLKQGMQIEKMQFDTFRRLSNAIALTAIVAWQLLFLKHLAAQDPEVAAEQVLEPLQVEVLQKQKGQKNLTVKQALIAIAALAGFTPSKKQPLPGEKTIWKGWFIFDKLCEGYKLASQESYGTR